MDFLFLIMLVLIDLGISIISGTLDEIKDELKKLNDKK